MLYIRNLNTTKTKNRHKKRPKPNLVRFWSLLAEKRRFALHGGERLALANRTAQKEFCLCSWKPAHISAFFHPPQEAVGGNASAPGNRHIETQILFRQKEKDRDTKMYLCLFGGEEKIWTSAPVTRPTPLAGAPLRPLEYFSIKYATQVAQTAVS